MTPRPVLRPAIRARAPRAMVIGAMLPLALLVACGEGTVEESPRSNRGDASVARTTDSTLADPAGPTMPATFATACLRGDPAEGRPWRIEGVDSTFSLVPTVTLADLTPGDSARLAARIARAVDVLPNDTTVADFRGLPVAVRVAWRLVPAEGDTVIAAVASRRLPIESAPLEESVFLVAVPGVRQGVRAPLLDRWVLRDVALEESMASRELVVAYAGPEDELTLAIVHDADAGVRAELLMRRAGAWRIEWSGPLPGCETR